MSCDLLLCRRYWWLASRPGYVFVENADGGSMGAIATKEQLDEVSRGLPMHGPMLTHVESCIREGPLLRWGAAG